MKIQAIKPIIWIFLAISLVSCGTTDNKPTKSATPSPYTYVDSTEYYLEDTASVSMRATFNNNAPQSGMVTGYKFQFRSLNPKPLFLSSISIIAGGKRLFVEEGQLVVANDKPITQNLNLQDSEFIAQYPDALLQFRANNQSVLFTIELHQLREFSP